MIYPKDVIAAIRDKASTYNMFVGLDRTIIGGIDRQYVESFVRSDEEIAPHLISHVEKQLKQAKLDRAVAPFDPSRPVNMPVSVAEFQAIFYETLKKGGLPAAGQYLGSLGLPNEKFVKNPETQL